MNEFHYDHGTDDSTPWSELDIEDLRASAESGDSLEDAATLLCRAGTLEEVKTKAQDLGLRFIDAVKVIPWEKEEYAYGVRVMHPGRTEQSYRVGSQADAHRAARKLRRSFTKLDKIGLQRHR
jgi:hypothetical protein